MKNAAYDSASTSTPLKAIRLLPAEIIAAKRDGAALSDEQIATFIEGYSSNAIPDYQMAAMAMAIFLNGMDQRETATLTDQMLKSGTCLNWPDDGIPRVDKHSTGGVGDKVSIPLAPLLAACGTQVPMLSGRGLGPTGGTLDKLESIAGFRTDLSLQEIQEVTQQTGCVITGASQELAPADRKLYALRDVTATVPSVPLITASIMSKKLAESLDALLLDVKFGSGAFMKTEEQARLLARSLVDTGTRNGVRTTALLTDMDQPLGRMCGNALEIAESVAILKNEGPADVRELTLKFAAELLVSTGLAKTLDEALATVTLKLESGHAFEKFGEMICAQSGDFPFHLKIAPAHDVPATTSGIITSIDTEKIGLCIIAMGGGRRILSDQINHAVGLEILSKPGDPVEVGQPIAKLYADSPAGHLESVQQAFTIGESAVPATLIAERITG